MATTTTRKSTVKTTSNSKRALTVATAATAPVAPDENYTQVLALLQERLSAHVGPMFVADIDGETLWKRWLGAFPARERQEHVCHACRRFIQTYGRLVVIGADGYASSLLFDPDLIASEYSRSFRAIFESVDGALVAGTFVSSEKLWGLPHNIDVKRACTWRHLSAVPPKSAIFASPVKTANARAAELDEDYGTLQRALAEFPLAIVEQALAISKSEALSRGEKIEGRLRWLVDLHQQRAATKLAWARDNITRVAASSAPAGFCHVKSSVIAPLLEDLAAGKPFAEVKRAFDAKMSPLQYMRPTAAPTAGNVKQAEEIVEKMGIKAALRRRFAKLEDITVKIWEPTPARAATVNGKPGVFGHLLTPNKAAPLAVAASAPMTWDKFSRTVLPNAECIELQAPANGNYHALVTAADPDAPMIFQWDHPVTWYTYVEHYQRSASAWNLRANTWTTVDAITPMPNMWAGLAKHAHHGSGVVLILAGCCDTQQPGVGIFPELLKSDLHPVRATIEAYSRGAKIEGKEGATACGIAIRAGAATGAVRVRVLARGIQTEYVIDRWD